MKSFKGAFLILLIGCCAIPEISPASPPGNGVRHLQARRFARKMAQNHIRFIAQVKNKRMVCNATPSATSVKKLPEVSRDLPCGCPAGDSHRAGCFEASEPKATAFTSDQPELTSAGIETGIEELFYDAKSDSYWLLGPQSIKSVTHDQAIQLLENDTASVSADESATAADNSEEVAEAFDDEEADTEPDTVADGTREKLIAEITRIVPPTIMVEDEDREPGWADYDNDGVVDEYFPYKKKIVNPELIKLLKDLEKPSLAQNESTE